MSEWSIDIPYQDRDDLVLDTITAAKERFGEDDDRTQVVRVLARDALIERGVTTVGGLLDELGGLDQAQTRQRLDWARSEAGLVTATEADQNFAARAFENEMARLEPPPPPRWSSMQCCPECGAFPMAESGALAEVDVERWWCPKHREGHEEDMEPHQPAYVLNENLALVPSEKERKRLELWHEEHTAREQREREAIKEADRREREAVEAARKRFGKTATISVLGIECHPADIRVLP